MTTIRGSLSAPLPANSNEGGTRYQSSPDGNRPVGGARVGVGDRSVPGSVAGLSSTTKALSDPSWKPNLGSLSSLLAEVCEQDSGTAQPHLRSAIGTAVKLSDALTVAQLVNKATEGKETGINSEQDLNKVLVSKDFGWALREGEYNGMRRDLYDLLSRAGASSSNKQTGSLEGLKIQSQAILDILSRVDQLKKDFANQIARLTDAASDHLSPFSLAALIRGIVQDRDSRSGEITNDEDTSDLSDGSPERRGVRGIAGRQKRIQDEGDHQSGRRRRRSADEQGADDQVGEAYAPGAAGETRRSADSSPQKEDKDASLLGQRETKSGELSRPVPALLRNGSSVPLIAEITDGNPSGFHDGNFLGLFLPILMSILRSREFFLGQLARKLACRSGVLEQMTTALTAVGSIEQKAKSEASQLIIDLNTCANALRLVLGDGSATNYNISAVYFTDHDGRSINAWDFLTNHKFVSHDEYHGGTDLNKDQLQTIINSVTTSAQNVTPTSDLTSETLHFNDGTVKSFWDWLTQNGLVNAESFSAFKDGRAVPISTLKTLLQQKDVQLSSINNMDLASLQRDTGEKENLYGLLSSLYRTEYKDIDSRFIQSM